MFSDVEIGVFLDELEEKVQIINDNLLVLEQEPDNQEVLQEIFRAAHTIKGSSGIMGYEKMASLTHHIEDLFDKIRQGKMTIDTKMINLFFEASDALNALKKEITGEVSNVDVSGVLVKLAECLEKNERKTAEKETAATQEVIAPNKEELLDAATLTTIQEKISGDVQAYQVTVTLDQACQMKSVRAFLIYETLEQMGKIIRSLPDQATLQAGNFQQKFELVLLSEEDSEHIQNTVLNIAEVQAVVVKNLSGENLFLETLDEETEKAVIFQPLDDVVEDVIREATIKGFQAYQIIMVLDEASQMKSVRAFLVYETMQQMGEIIRSIPSAEDLQEGRFESEFELILLTQEDQDQVHNTLMSVAEVQDVKIKNLNNYLTQEKKEPDNQVPVAGLVIEEKAENKENKEVHQVKTVKTVRVDVQKLDNLMNLVGELVIDRTRLNRFAEVFEGKFGSDDLVESINEISNHLGTVTGDLQEQIMKARMLPIAQIFNRFPRMVRDTAQKLGKEIDFIVEGKETELDRNVIEVIGDPLIHLIRNAIDHGIESPAERVQAGKPETGKLLLKASYHESHIVITIADDGKGMDAEKIRSKAVSLGWYDEEGIKRLSDREVLDFIFKPGFSMAQKVSDLSGRGVGMDVVRTAIEQINGMVELDTKLGSGSKFTIRLPLTLAIIRSLMVSLGEQVYAFPLSNVQETLRINVDEIRRIGNSEVIVVRERILPLLRLKEHFDLGSHEAERLFVVIIASAEKRVAVVVDKLLGEQEVVIKSLGEYLGEVVGLSGATILGDGRVALIIDTRSIVNQAGTVEGAKYAG